MSRRQGARPGARTILVVARQAETRAELARILVSAGYAVELAEGLDRARDVIAKTRIDCGIVVAETADEFGPELPLELAGWPGELLIAAEHPAVLERLRPPGRGQIVASIDPFEIAARLEELLRDSDRSMADPQAPEMLAFEGFTLDLSGYVLTNARGQEVALTAAEFAMLVTFVRAPGRVLSRDRLRAEVSGGRESEPYDRSIDIMVSRLRRKLGDDPKSPRLILTVPGAGYKFAAKPGSPHYAPRVEAPALAPVLNGRPAQPEPAEAEERPAERRQLTILACEFAGAPALSARLDAEEFHGLIEAHQQRCRDVIAAHHGRVATILADGLIAYFGDPQAQENDAEHAVRAGLGLIALPGPTVTASGLQARIGIASGVVVMNPLAAGSPERTAVGDAPNLAQRLRGAAEPGGLVIAESTRDLVRGLFEYRELGRVALDGYPEPVSAWQVVGTSAIASRFQATRASDRTVTAPARHGLTPFVGRSEELRTLTQLAAAAAGGLTVIHICGEPGIGKSRLLHEFRADLMRRNVFVMSGNCWPDGKDAAFRPFIDVVRRAFRLVAADTEADVARKLQRALAMVGLAGDENMTLLMNLLGRGRTDALEGMDGVQIGLRTRELLFEVMQERSRVGPLALLLEDLQWVDSASEELLARFIESQSSLPLLIVNTFRPEYAPPWTGQPGTTTLRLAPLSAADTTRLVEARLQSFGEAAPLVPLIVERAEGNPLFAEEIANFVVDRIGTPAASRPALDSELTAAIPASLQSLLVARMDRLAQSDRSMLQAASAIGRQFSVEVLAAVTGATDLPSRLSAMEALDLVRRDPKTGEFVFKHALVRDALYGSLLAAARGDLHLGIAQEIERRAASGPIEVAEVLAHHYAQTSATDKSIEFLTLAGRKSFGIYSIDEAEGYLRQALTLAREAHPGALDDRSIDIMTDLMRVFTVQWNTRDAIALVEPQLDAIMARTDHPRIPILLYFYGFALFATWRFRDGRRIQDKALALAERHGDPKTRAYAIAGVIYLSTAIEPLPLHEFEALAAEALSAAQDGRDAYLFASVSMAVAWNYSNRGLLNEGRAWAQRLLRFGRERRDARSIAIALWIEGWLDLVADDHASALHRGEEAIAVVSTQINRILAGMLMATAQIYSGAVQEGMALMQHVRHEIEANGWIYLYSGTDGAVGLGMMLSGRFGAGLSWLRAYLARVEAARPVAGTGFAQVFLAQVYVAIACDNRRPPLKVLLTNLPSILKAKITGLAQAERLLAKARLNPMFSPEGIYRARIELALGRIALARKRTALARGHLERARDIARHQNAAVMQGRIEAILATV